MTSGSKIPCKGNKDTHLTTKTCLDLVQTCESWGKIRTVYITGSTQSLCSTAPMHEVSQDQHRGKPWIVLLPLGVRGERASCSVTLSDLSFLFSKAMPLLVRKQTQLSERKHLRVSSLFSVVF